MAGYKKHVFVCQHTRDGQTGKKACGNAGSAEFRKKLKKEVLAAGLNKEIRINAAGCLGHCSKGPAMVIYPQGTWYGAVQSSDLDEILDKSIFNDVIISRLRIQQGDDKKTSTA